MPVITLTTDWNKNDYYLAATKGLIIQTCPNTTIIDISHQIPSFNVVQAAFLIKNSYRHFPKGTIHIIGVNSASGPDTRFLGVSFDDQYFLSYDNGIFGLIFKDKPEEAIEIKTFDNFSPIFPELTILAVAACKIVKGIKLKNLGKKVKDFAITVPLRAAIDESVITGSVIYIDSYRNAITNITRELFNRVGQNRNFEILIQSDHYRITRINQTYGETTIGEILAIFNSINLLEIAINRGNAADLLGLDTSSSIRIKFKK